MSDWDACLAEAAAGWGQQYMTFAREDLAGAAPLPALTIIEDAATFLAQRGYWEDPEPEWLVALRACHLAHRADGDFISREVTWPTRFGGRGQPWELAEMFLADLQAAAWTLLPEVACGCGVRYKRLDNAVGRGRLFGAVDSASDRLLRPVDACACGRLVGDIDTGEPGQLHLDITAAEPQRP